ncbi:MAG: DUF2116 family Zn-ribbon domain-containing protein [Promethearchaeia archaeon]|nr:MAG: DUF2116 family Zn-ribbon domain-containing protein [Candidatus Lokiarchaeia archaeon]
MSKYDKYKNDGIFPHKHCPICFKIIPEEGTEYGEYCSAECAGVKKTEKKSKKRRYIIMFASYGIMIVVFVIMMILSRG